MERRYARYFFPSKSKIRFTVVGDATMTGNRSMPPKLFTFIRRRLVWSPRNWILTAFAATLSCKSARPCWRFHSKMYHFVDDVYQQAMQSQIVGSKIEFCNMPFSCSDDEARGLPLLCGLFQKLEHVCFLSQCLSSSGLPWENLMTVF